jgi:hypothetical protein
MRRIADGFEDGSNPGRRLCEENREDRALRTRLVSYARHCDKRSVALSFAVHWMETK